MEFKIPASLQLEHKELHTELAKATQITGKLGEAAKNVAAILDPHFRKEEECTLPLMGLIFFNLTAKAKEASLSYLSCNENKQILTIELALLLPDKLDIGFGCRQKQKNQRIKYSEELL